MSGNQLQSHLEFVNNLVAHLPPQGFDSQLSAPTGQPRTRDDMTQIRSVRRDRALLYKQVGT